MSLKNFPMTVLQDLLLTIDDGMGGIDVSALDLSTLGEYSEEKPAENDDNIYTDDEDYTFDADPSSIQLSEMDN